MGSFKPHRVDRHPDQRRLCDGTLAGADLGMWLLFIGRELGLRMRATVQNRAMSGAVGINTGMVDRCTFALGCGIAGVAGAAFTTIGSTGPDSGSRYIVDTFLVVVFGGAASLLGTIASAFGSRRRNPSRSSSWKARWARWSTLLVIVLILMIRPQGLFPSKVRSV